MNTYTASPDPQAFLDAARWISLSAPYLALLVLLGAGGWGWVTVQRARRVQQALAGRVTVEVVPTASFNPSESEIGRWARHLGRVHHAADGVPARGSAARIRYSVEAGQMHCYLEGPETAAAVLAMPGFAEVEVRVHRAHKDIQPVRFTLPAQHRGDQ